MKSKLGNESPRQAQADGLPSGSLLFCPYLDQGPAACYCRNLNSKTAPLIVRYCGGAFQECDLFRTEEDRGKKE